MPMHALVASREKDVFKYNSTGVNRQQQSTFLTRAAFREPRMDQSLPLDVMLNQRQA